MSLQPKRLLLATLLAASGAFAIAQTAAPAAPAQPAAGTSAQRAGPGDRSKRMDPAQWEQRRAERHAQHLTELKGQLKLSPAQEGAWSAYAAAMQPPANAQHPRMDRAEFDKLTTPQRIDRMQQFADERQAQMKQRGDAVKAFYAQLTPEQQKTYDERAMPRGGRHGGGHMHRHGMGMGRG